MSKRYQEPIELRLAADHCPRAFVWRGRNYEINEVLKRWTVSGDWWQQESRRLHAVVAAKHYGELGQYEIVYVAKQKQWFLHRVYD